MNLGIARVCKTSAAFVGTECCRDVAARGIRGKKVGIAIPAGSKNDGIGRPRLDGSGHKVSGDNSLGVAVHHHHVEHLVAIMHFHLPRSNLPAQRTVGAKQELLPGLAAGIEGPTYLSSPKRAIGQKPPVLASKGNSLRHALVDDIAADLSKSIDVGFP